MIDDLVMADLQTQRLLQAERDILAERADLSWQQAA
jgi:hypothetical protein